MSKLNKGLSFLLCVIDIFSKYAWVVHLKDKKGVRIDKAFQETLNDSASSKAKSKGRKPGKIWLTKEVNFTIIFLKND